MTDANETLVPGENVEPGYDFPPETGVTGGDAGDTSFYDFNDGEDIGDTPDLMTAPNGEYQLQLNEFRAGRGKESGKPYWMAVVEIIGQPNAPLLYHTMMLPQPDDKPRTAQARKRELKYFCQAFQVPMSGRVVFEDHLGKVAWGFVKEEDDSNSQIGKRNRVTRWNVGA